MAGSKTHENQKSSARKVVALKYDTRIINTTIKNIYTSILNPMEGVSFKRERSPEPLIPGLGYVDDFISADEEAQLMEHIDGSVWDTTLKRRTQHYGYRYNYTQGSVAQVAPPIPEWCNFLIERFDVRPDQLIINEYEPGQGIGPHIDSVSSFADGIVSVSLGADIVMEFKHKTSGATKSLQLKRRSMLSLHREARYDWRHSITAKKSDSFIMRKRRVSLTFRKIK